MLAGFVMAVVQWLFTSFGKLGIAWLRYEREKREIIDQAEKDALVLKKAVTVDEKELAARRIADDSF